jgi:hypothetical protein
MTSKIKNLFLSKRFIAFLLCLICWVVLSLTTDIDVISSATGLSMLSLIYSGSETIRQSVNKIKEDEKG